jgi:hypothetical protein
MSRLRREIWGERPRQENKININLLSKAELLEMAHELLGIAPHPKPALA